jgi:hypothetical protein
MGRPHVLVPACAGALAVLLTGRASGATKHAIYLDPSFEAPVVAEIKVLPMVDARADKSQVSDFEKHVRQKAIKALQKKAYVVGATETVGDVGEIVEEDLRAPDAAWVKKLGPSDARWVLLLMLLDLKTKVVFGSTGNAEIAGVLCDKEAGTIVWRDKGIGRAGQGGLIGMAMKGSMDESALDAAVSNLLASVPSRKEKRK